MLIHTHTCMGVLAYVPLIYVDTYVGDNVNSFVMRVKINFRFFLPSRVVAPLVVVVVELFVSFVFSCLSCINNYCS